MTAYQTPAPLERYLRRATLGLPAARREEVWNELEEHVLCRAERLEFTGLSPEKALAQALRELGPPLRVSAGMNGVHNMPKMIALGVTGILALSAGLYALAGGTAKVVTLPTLTDAPQTQCIEVGKPQPKLTLVSHNSFYNCYQDDKTRVGGSFVSLQTVKQAVEAVGGQATFTSDERLHIQLPGGTADYRPDFRQGGQGYTRTSEMLSMLVWLQMPSQKQVPQMTIQGYTNPRLHIGETTIRLNQPGQEALGYNLYAGLSDLAIDQLVYQSNDDPRQHHVDYVNEGKSKSYTVPLQAGEVVVALSQPQKGRFSVEVAEVSSGGQMTLHSPVKNGSTPRFVLQPGQLQPADAGQPLPTVLIRMTNTPLNDIKSGIFLPK